MRASIDHVINRFARRTHSPRGRHAASEQTYQQLLHRIPEAERPVIGPSLRQPRSFSPRWSAAACLCLVVGIGLAIAAICYHQFLHAPSAAGPQPVSEQSVKVREPRQLVFEQAPLSDITAQLSEIYDTTISILNPELLSYRITATFRTDEPLDEILHVLAETGQFDVTETPDGFVIE